MLQIDGTILLSEIVSIVSVCQVLTALFATLFLLSVTRKQFTKSLSCYKIAPTDVP